MTEPVAHKTWLQRNLMPVCIVGAAVAFIAVLGAIPRKKAIVPPPQVVPVNVVILTVVALPEMPDSFDLPGVVEANHIVTVAAEVSGRIERTISEEGKPVQTGDLLVEINTDLLQAEFKRAEAQEKYDRAEYARMETLVAGGAAPSRDLEAAAARAAISQAILEEVRARLRRARIIAPISGVLNDLRVEQGEYVQPGAPVAQIVDIRKAKVVVEVSERDIPSFRIGQTGLVFIGAGETEQSMEGPITFISATAHADTRSTRAEITVDNPDGRLRSGQIVRVRLTRQLLRDVIMIPLQAVIPLESGKAVFVVSDGKASRRDVELGTIRGDRVQAVRGLAPGDQLIVSGHRFVGPGQPVNIVTPDGAANKGG